MLNWMSEGVKEGLSSEETSIGSPSNIFSEQVQIFRYVESANDEFVQHYTNNALNEHNDPSNSFKSPYMMLIPEQLEVPMQVDAQIVTHKEVVPDSGDGYDPTINPSTDPSTPDFKLKWEKEGIPMTIPMKEEKNWF